MMLGTALLSLPFCRAADQPFSLMANFFTATSALCVTGLSVVDIGSYYTLAGQITILLLIQVGGLGYMTLSTILGISSLG
jgi:trk system potassium uptake protein TrkH